MNRDQLVEQAVQIHMGRTRELGMLAEGFVGRSETRILIWLRRQEEDVCAVDIMEYFGLSAGRVSNVLKALEEKGYISREHTNADHRRMLIAFTEKGAACAKEMEENLYRVFDVFFTVLGEKEAQAFIDFEKRLLQRVRDGEIKIVPPLRI